MVKDILPNVKNKGYCAYCKIKKKRSSGSGYICEGCSEKSNIHLCLDPCLKKFYLLGDDSRPMHKKEHINTT